MKDNFKRYVAMLEVAAETANACLDMEGGVFFLAWIGELLQELTAAGCFQSACLAVKRLFEAFGVKPEWTEYDGLGRVEKQAWMKLFAGALLDHVMTAGK